MPEKTYTVIVECDNCGASNILTIPKGMTVKAFTGPEKREENWGRIRREHAKPCTNCHCYALSPDSPTPLIYG